MTGQHMIAVIANFIIGISGIVLIPTCLIWLYARRRSHWPNAWILLVFSMLFVLEASARLLYTFNGLGYNTGAFPLTLDCMLSACFLAMAVIVPFVVTEIRYFPSPLEYQKIKHDAGKKRDSDSVAIWERKKREEADKAKLQLQRKLDKLHTILQSIPALPEDTKDRIVRIVEEAE